MSEPRFEDSDFIKCDEKADSQNALGISQRGMELLQNINELIDKVTTQQPGGPNMPIIIQFSEK